MGCPVLIHLEVNLSHHSNTVPYNNAQFHSILQCRLYNTGMDISAMLSFRHHATNLARHTVELNHSPDTTVMI